MREILFRRVFKHFKTGQFKTMEWGPVWEDGKNGVFNGPPSLSLWNAVADEQYTDVLDKNKVRIFEGDIIKFVYGGEIRIEEVVFCMGMSFTERLRVLFTGKIWVSLMTFNQPLTPSFHTTKKSDVLKP